MDGRADRTHFALRVAGPTGGPAPAAATWDPETASIELARAEDLRLQLRYLDPWAPSDLKLVVVTRTDEGLAPHERLVQATENNTLRLNAEYYPEVHAVRCPDERCLLTGEDDEVPVDEHTLNLNALPEGWYALVGVCSVEGPCPAGRAGTYAGPLAVGSPPEYHARFRWGPSVTLLLAVVLVWAVWAIFDKLMKRGR